MLGRTRWKMLRVTPNLCHLSRPSEPWSPVLCFSCFALTVPLDTGPSAGEVLWWDIRFHQPAVRHGPPVPGTVFIKLQMVLSVCMFYFPICPISLICAVSPAYVRTDMFDSSKTYSSCTFFDWAAVSLILQLVGLIIWRGVLYYHRWAFELKKRRALWKNPNQLGRKR